MPGSRHPVLGYLSAKLRCERGSATAELAVVVPVIVLMLALMISGLSAAGAQVQLNGATADAARLLARGEGSERVSARMSQLGEVSSVNSHSEGELVCVSAQKQAPVPLQMITLSAKSCLLKADW